MRAAAGRLTGRPKESGIIRLHRPPLLPRRALARSVRQAPTASIAGSAGTPI